MDSPAIQAHQPLASKRKRLSYACNYCRIKKTRCDEQQPRCRACAAAGIECITTDKRRPHAQILSRRKSASWREEQRHHARLASSPLSIDTTLTRHTGADDGRQVGLEGIQQARVDDMQHIDVDDGQRAAVDEEPLSRRPHDTTSIATETTITPQARRELENEHLPMMPSPQAETNIVRQLTQWLELAFARLKRPQQFMTYLTDSHSTAAEVPLGLFLNSSGPDLPDAEAIRGHITAFFAYVHPIFPFLRRNFVDSAANRVCASIMDPGSLHGRDIPTLALVYLMCTFGMIAGPHSSESQATIDLYLLYCSSLVGHLMAFRSTESVQIILLFSIVLRVRDRLTWSWDLLTMAVSMAQSLLLHEASHPRQLPKLSGAVYEESDEQLTWWSLYAFEKILGFEIGRQSVIRYCSLSTIRPGSNCAPRLSNYNIAIHRSEVGYKEALISLANLLHEIQTRSIYSWGQEELVRLRQQDAIAKIIRTAGEIDTMLKDWQESLPVEYQ